MIDAMKGRLVQSHAERRRRIEDGELPVVGVNMLTETAASPLVTDDAEHILVVDPAAEAEQVEHLARWRAEPGRRRGARRARRGAARRRHRREPRAGHDRAGPGGRDRRRVGRRAARDRSASTGPRPASAPRCRHRPASCRPSRDAGQGRGARPRRPLRLLVAKPGLDGHSNGAEQLAVAARDAGLEVIYQGIRLTPAEIAAAARDEDVDVVGLSILSGSHRRWCRRP